MYMTIDEIYEKYNENWVFLINCKKNEKGDDVGEVAFTTKTLKELYEEIDKRGYTLGEEEIDTMFFGIPPKGTVYLI